MGNLPFGIDRIAVETAAQVIVNTAQRHFSQGGQHGGFRRPVRFAALDTGGPAPQQLLQAGGMRELGGATEAAVHRIEAVDQRVPCRPQWRVVQHRRVGCGGRGDFGAQGIQQGLVLLAEFRLMLAVVGADPAQDIGKGRHPVAGRLGEIGTADEGYMIVVG